MGAKTRVPRLESGAVETMQVTTVTDSDGLVVDDSSAPRQLLPREVLPTTAMLNGAEMNTIRARVEIVDRAAAEAKTAQEAARFRSQLAQIAQSELSQQIMNLVRQYGLDESFEYRLDPDSAQIIQIEASQR